MSLLKNKSGRIRISVVLAAYAAAMFSFPFGIDSYRGVKYNHSLKNKLGFEKKGEFEDGRRWTYSVEKVYTMSLLSNHSVKETVWENASNGTSVSYEDWNEDKTVDRVWVSALHTFVDRTPLGIKYDSQLMNAGQALELLVKGNLVLAKIKEDKTLENELGVYSVKRSSEKIIDSVISK